MNKTIAGIIVGVVVVAGGAYFVLNNNKLEEKLEPTEEGVPNPALDGSGTSAPLETLNPNASGKKMAFSQFLKQGGSYECIVNQTIDNVAIQGTTYINNGMVRGEFYSRVLGMGIDSHFIIRDGYTYSWTSAMSQTNSGFKTKTVASAGDVNAAPSGSYSFNAEQIGDYDCKPWTLDASKFTIPTNITFKDVSVK